MTRRAVFLDVGAIGPRAREGGALAASLAGRGFAIERLPDGQTTLEALAREPADLLVIDADSPSLDLRAFMEALRGEARTASTLVVALASGDPRELPARREIALTLSKPIHADEASSRLEALFRSGFTSRLVGVLALPVLRRLQAELAPARHNGASFLGLQGIVVKSHGSAGQEGFQSAIRRAVVEVRENLPRRLHGRLEDLLL